MRRELKLIDGKRGPSELLSNAERRADLAGSAVKVADSDEDIAEGLVAKGVLSLTEAQQVHTLVAEQQSDSFLKMLVALGVVAEAELLSALSSLLDVPILGRQFYRGYTNDPEPLARRFLLEHLVLPIRREESVQLAMVDPTDVYAISAVELIVGSSVEVAVALADDIRQGIEFLYGENLGKSTVEVRADSEFDVSQLRDMASEAPVIRWVNQLLQKAREEGASDVHIEPFENSLVVRYRIDGILRLVEAPDYDLAPAIVSRVKIMASLDIAERRLPQDGRVKLKMAGQNFDIRISTVPCLHGESVVMRLLDRGDVKLDLGSLGYADDERETLISLLHEPNGLLLVAGPTGSGKTTTLYAALNVLNSPERKIITAEDPVEYQIDGVNQIQVKPSIGLTFASVLRSIVRQDPDVILVGETRDLETARMCVQSSLTGHMVLSTLHTNSAVASITRMLEMGVEDYLLVSTLTGIVSQRLVRKLCLACRTESNAPRELLVRHGLDGASITYDPKGCDACGGSGFNGRSSIQEILLPNDELREAVLQRADARSLEKIAQESGMKTLFQDGLEKVSAGTTSIQELLRVTRDA